VATVHKAALLERALWEQGSRRNFGSCRTGIGGNELFADLGTRIGVRDWDEFDENRIDQSSWECCGRLLLRIGVTRIAVLAGRLFDDALRIAKRVKLDGTTPGKGAF